MRVKKYYHITNQLTKENKAGTAGLIPARYDNSKGNRIGASYLYTSKLITNIYNNYSIIIFFSTVPSSQI